MSSDHKYIICLGDGMADEPVESLGGKTPLEKAHTPYMDQLATESQCGWVHTVPEGLHPGSDVCNMGILGYDPRNYYTGRGPIEAAAMKIQVPEGKIIFRCNLVYIENNIMKDFTSGHISTPEADQLIQELNTHFKDKATFFTGVGYRHIVLLDESLLNLKTTAPHDITDQSIFDFTPKGQNEQIMDAFTLEARKVLALSEVNQKRKNNNQSPATDIWPWSQGKMPKLPSFKSTFGKTGGIVTAVDLLKGLGTLTDLETPMIEGATGFLDTNYENKVQAAFDILKEHSFVYLHIEAPDEAGHMGDAELKTKAIEDFDQNVMQHVLNYKKQHPNTHILVLPDHPTPVRIKTHTSEKVPFIHFAPNKPSNNISQYNEISMQESTLEYQTPWDLTKEFLNA